MVIPALYFPTLPPPNQPPPMVAHFNDDAFKVETGLNVLLYNIF